MLECYEKKWILLKKKGRKSSRTIFLFQKTKTICECIQRCCECIGKISPFPCVNEIKPELIMYIPLCTLFYLSNKLWNITLFVIKELCSEKCGSYKHIYLKKIWRSLDELAFIPSLKLSLLVTIELFIATTHNFDSVYFQKLLYISMILFKSFVSLKTQWWLSFVSWDLLWIFVLFLKFIET